MKQKLTNLISDYEMKLEALRLLYSQNPDKYFGPLESAEIITVCLRRELERPDRKEVSQYYAENRERLKAKSLANYYAKKERKNEAIN